MPMSIHSLREVRDRFSDVVDRVEREHERAAVTRNGRAAAVILSPEDLAELEEIWTCSATLRHSRTYPRPTRPTSVATLCE